MNVPACRWVDMGYMVKSGIWSILKWSQLSYGKINVSAQARITDIAKLEGKLDSENGARKAEIAALDSWAKGENDARKTEIENLGRIRFNSILSTRK